MHYGAGSSDYTSGPPQFAKAQDHPLALSQSSRAQFHDPQQDLGYAAPPSWDYTTPPLGIKHFRHFPGNDITPKDSASQASSDRKSSRYYKSSKTGRSSRTSKSSRSSSLSLRLQESLKKASLEAEAAALRRKHELLMKETKLNIEKESLELDTKLAISAARK